MEYIKTPQYHLHKNTKYKWSINTSFLPTNIIADDPILKTSTERIMSYFSHWRDLESFKGKINRLISPCHWYAPERNIKRTCGMKESAKSRTLRTRGKKRIEKNTEGEPRGRTQREIDRKPTGRLPRAFHLSRSFPLCAGCVHPLPAFQRQKQSNPPIRDRRTRLAPRPRNWRRRAATQFQNRDVFFFFSLEVKQRSRGLGRSSSHIHHGCTWTGSYLGLYNSPRAGERESSNTFGITCGIHTTHILFFRSPATRLRIKRAILMYTQSRDTANLRESTKRK